MNFISTTHLPLIREAYPQTCRLVANSMIMCIPKVCDRPGVACHPSTRHGWHATRALEQYPCSAPLSMYSTLAAPIIFYTHGYVHFLFVHRLGNRHVSSWSPVSDLHVTPCGISFPDVWYIAYKNPLPPPADFLNQADLLSLLRPPPVTCSPKISRVRRSL